VVKNPAKGLFFFENIKKSFRFWLRRKLYNLLELGLFYKKPLQVFF
jgi:hypothetical protein